MLRLASRAFVAVPALGSVLAAIAVPSTAAEYEWMPLISPGFSSAAYAVPESSFIALALRCDHRQPGLVTIEPEIVLGPGVGGELVTIFDIDQQPFKRTAYVSGYNEMLEGHLPAVVIRADDPLLGAIAAGEVLRVGVSADGAVLGEITIPLDGFLPVWKTVSQNC